MYRIKLVIKSYLFFFKLLLVLSVTMISFSLQAQNDTIVPVDKDPEEILKNLDLRRLPHFNIWNDTFSGHWAGFDMGFNMFWNENYSGYDFAFLDNDILRSNSAYINLIQKSIGLQRNRNTVGLVTGLGLHLQSYRLEKNTSIQQQEDGRIEPKQLYFDQNHKSKLSLVSLMVPLLAEFQMPVNHYNNRIYISGGLYGSYRLSSHTKVKYRTEIKKEKLKGTDHYSLQDFNYGLMVRTGYRWVNIFATYELVPFFKADKGPQLTPVTIGISLISF